MRAKGYSGWAEEVENCVIFMIQLPQLMLKNVAQLEWMITYPNLLTKNYCIVKIIKYIKKSIK